MDHAATAAVPQGRLSPLPAAMQFGGGGTANRP